MVVDRRKSVFCFIWSLKWEILDKIEEFYKLNHKEHIVEMDLKMSKKHPFLYEAFFTFVFFIMIISPVKTWAIVKNPFRSSTTVNLTIYNLENFDQDVQLAIKDHEDSQSKQIQLGIIPPNKEVKKRFKVRHNGRFVVTSRSCLSSAIIFEETRSVTNTDPDPFDITVNLKQYKNFGTFSINLIEEAIRLRRGGVSDSFIVEHLYHLNPDTGNVFGNARIREDDIKKLKEAGFDDDFIAKFEGHPQYITVGVASVFLIRTSNLEAATMLRILLEPRSYFKRLRPYWRKLFWKIYWPEGITHYDRLGLTLGITTSTPTGEKSESINYVLVGLSNELNRLALLNFGFALAPKDIKEGKKKQLYIGLTLDSNSLKALGIIGK
jgi:hypothetical protein